MATRDDQKEIHSLIKEYLGYSSHREVTNLDPRYLVRGSYDCFIEEGGKVSIRPGYELYGQEATNQNGIRSSYDWDTSTGVTRNVRSTGDSLEVYYDDEWTNVEEGFNGVDFCYDSWWDDTEGIDVLLMVQGNDDIYEWSGAITKAASVTANTITKMFIVSGTTFSFTAKVGSTPAFISDSGNGFVTAGFAAGDNIVVTGSVSNDGTYIVAAVTASTLTLALVNDLTAEAAGAAVVINKENMGTWAEERFYTANTRGTRMVRINGIDYTYTGGENTRTLTGVTPNPTGNVSNGDTAMQTMLTTTNAPISTNRNNWIKVLNNYLFVGSSYSRTVYMSHNDDYTDFTFTSPLRTPGEGAKFTLDSYSNGFVVQEEDVYMGAGRDFVYKTTFSLTAHGLGETVNIKRLKTTPGQSWISQNSISHIKNSAVFITYEPTLDTLGRLEQIVTPESKPLSDIIKLDFDMYNFAGAHTKYFKNYVYCALPAEGLLLLYDLERQLWQPPWNLSLRCLSIINNNLVGHSATTNESYTLLTGTEDNGAPITWRMAFAYRNGNVRDLYKVFDEYFTEAYQSIGGDVLLKLRYEYRGSLDEKIFILNTDNPNNVFSPTNQVGGFGQFPLGQQPFGANLPLPEDGTSADPNFPKVRFNHTMVVEDCFEWQTVYEGGTLGQRFQLIAHGPNATLSNNMPVSITV